MTHFITLTKTEQELAEFLGNRRQNDAVKQGKIPKHGFKGEALKIHIEGVAGEIAAAKAMNVYFPAHINTYRTKSDLEYGVEVRTRSNPKYDLLVRPDDSDHCRFVLVIGSMPDYTVYGWITGKEAKQDKWLKDYADRPAAYFVPKEELKSMLELYKQISIENALAMKDREVNPPKAS